MKNLKLLLFVAAFAIFGTAAIFAVQGQTYVDRSGALNADATSQVIAPANAQRTYFLFQNVSDIDMWINFGTAAVADKPSIKVLAGGNYEPLVPPLGTVNVIGATAGKKFVCKEAP